MLGAVNNATIRQVSAAIYQAVLAMRQSHPEWLHERYRSLPWEQESHKTAFISKLELKLSKAPNPESLLTEVEIVLKLLATAAYFQTVEFQQLWADLNSILQPSVSSQNQATETEQSVQSEVAEVEADNAIAILLLDAENLKPDVAVEAFLAKACTYPLRVKIAFANWRNQGKYDAELHNRHYDLIHVPNGNDMADGKMIVVGSSIRDRYPAAKEVLVCSSDKVMSNLCTKLRQEGLTVFQVRQQCDVIIVTNSETGTHATYSTTQLPAIPSLEDCIAQLKEIIRGEQQHGSAWVRLSKVSKLFRDQMGVAVSQVVATHSPGKKARDLFVDHPQHFAIHQPPKQTELYVSLFEDIALAPIKPSPQQEGEAHQNGKQPNSQSVFTLETAQALVTFQSRSQLEKAILQLVSNLTDERSNNFTDISTLGSQFHIRYRQPITAVIKQLQLNQRFPAFLKSCDALLVEQKGKVWQVRLRTRSQV